MLRPYIFDLDHFRAPGGLCPSAPDNSPDILVLGSLGAGAEWSTVGV